MRNDTLPTAVIALVLGLAGGAATTYFWLDRFGGFDVHGTATAPEAHEEGPSSHDHDAHAKEGEHDEHGAGRVKLSAEAIQEFGVKVATAGGGTLERTIKVPAEIVFNADRVAHIVPRVSGIVHEVHKNVGDQVKTGELMAVMESRELAEAKAADLGAEARLKLAEKNFARIEDLLQKKIAPEQEFYEARQQLDEANIRHRETTAKLHALGFNHDELNSIANEKETGFSRYEIKAPFSATVVDKHMTLGEVHDSNSDVFMLADLSTVWVDITIYPQDSARVHAGSKVRLSAPGPDGQATKVEGTVFYVSPILRESTRTGLARAVITNDKGLWKPGQFVTAEIVIGREIAKVLVPNEAIQTIANQPVVFVEENNEFEKRAVVLGAGNETYSAVTSGLKPGEQVVVQGAFILKAELSKGAGGHEH